MLANLTASDLIASALKLSREERRQVLYAIEESLVDDSVDHGPVEPAEEVTAAWDAEIARRIADIDSGRVKLIPAEEAERMIRGDA